MNASRVDDKTTTNNGTLAGRANLASLILSLLAAATILLGAWGVVSSFGEGPAPAAPGEEVAVGDGFLRVDSVTPERMAPMQSGKFAANGMSMSAMGMDMAPEGKKRVSVEVTLAGGEEESLAYSPEDFRVSGEGFEPSAPIRHKLEAGEVPAGSAVSGSLVFEVPEESENLLVEFDGGRPVALDLSNTGEPGGPHGH
jgi:hypothetical protein